MQLTQLVELGLGFCKHLVIFDFGYLCLIKLRFLELRLQKDVFLVLADQALLCLLNFLKVLFVLKLKLLNQSLLLIIVLGDRLRLLEILRELFNGLFHVFVLLL